MKHAIDVGVDAGWMVITAPLRRAVVGADSQE